MAVNRPKPSKRCHERFTAVWQFSGMILQVDFLLEATHRTEEESGNE
jgi:hypothetical protein